MGHSIPYFPQITSCSQLQGRSNSTVSVGVQSTHEFTPGTGFTLGFATKRVACAIQLVGDPSAPMKQYLLSAEVPPFQSTGWHSFEVPLRMTMETGSAHSTLGVQLGNFTYTGQTVSLDIPRKRRYSSESQEDVSRPLKKAAAQVLNDAASDNGSFAADPYSPYTSTPMPPTLSLGGNDRNTPTRRFAHSCSDSLASVNSVKAQSPQTPPSWSPSFPPAKHSHHVSKASIDTQRFNEEEYPGQTLPLVRTSTIQQPAVMGHIAPPVNFNPYTMYPSKAVLKLNGNLDAMVEGWSHEEWDAKRRLVQFTRSQDCSTIHAEFKAVAPEDRQPNSICISCIWWEEKKAFFVTSVDTIFLLESLVAVRFTVEEKNRIRRNLEGFRPLTVSKSKVDSEEFFKVIMGFPNPKPRNIEKDVKVFPWKILSMALKKIIGKYSASYSSTAAALPTPLMAHYPAHESLDAVNEVRCSASPQPINLPQAPSPHLSHTPNYSPHVAPQHDMQIPVSGAPPDLRLQVPTLMPGYSYPATHSHPPQTYSQPMRGSPQPMTAPPAAGRLEQWEESAYMPYGPATTTANAIEPYHYNSDLSVSQGYMSTPTYSLSTSGI